MQQRDLRAKTPSRLQLALIALAIGIVVIGAEAILTGSADYLLSAFADEAGPLFFNVLFVSAPFLLLALRGVTRLLPWIVGLVLTLAVWGYIIGKFVSGGFEGGSSVGNAIWMAMVMLGSSAVITIICALLSRRSRG